MITVHHLNNSRSHRILWMLEELGLDYNLVVHHRDAETNLAPPELLKIHPLGKSPVLIDGDKTIIESGAILEYLTRTYGKGKFAPDISSSEYIEYSQLMHYAEGSAMLPIMLRLYAGRLGDAAAPLMPRIDSETQNHLGYLNGLIEGQDYFLKSGFSAADIQLSFVLEAANIQGQLAPFKNLQACVARNKARPAYQRALERGGPYAF
ncbi:MAG: glutathione S-transferase [Alphaproteobacteria bacterium]|nr:MAG: glutathione S-transferase [Alphaproteobacteria bacterium]